MIKTHKTSTGMLIFNSIVAKKEIIPKKVDVERLNAIINGLNDIKLAIDAENSKQSTTKEVVITNAHIFGKTFSIEQDVIKNSDGYVLYPYSKAHPKVQFSAMFWIWMWFLTLVKWALQFYEVPNQSEILFAYSIVSATSWWGSKDTAFFRFLNGYIYHDLFAFWLVAPLVGKGSWGRFLITIIANIGLLAVIFGPSNVFMYSWLFSRVSVYIIYDIILKLSLFFSRAFFVILRHITEEPITRDLFIVPLAKSMQHTLNVLYEVVKQIQ